MPRLASPIGASSVRTRFPELILATYSVADLDRAAALAMRIDSTSTEAALHLAAHLAVIEKIENTGEIDGGSGVVRQESTGPFNQTFNLMTSSGDDDTFFEKTSYGRAYLMIRNRTPARVMPFVVG